jgi:imidazolonepropionase-like amidohydrolase
MARTVFTKGLVFDGSGAEPTPGEVVVDGDRVVEVRAGWRDGHGDDQVFDATGCTVMPGMIESHAHLTFPSAVGHLDPSFNPPLDVSFFHHIEGLPSELARAERNAAILLDAGFTSAYSAGSLLPMQVRCRVRACARRAWSETTIRYARTGMSSPTGRGPRPAPSGYATWRPRGTTA